MVDPISFNSLQEDYIEILYPTSLNISSSSPLSHLLHYKISAVEDSDKITTYNVLSWFMMSLGFPSRIAQLLKITNHFLRVILLKINQIIIYTAAT